MHYLTVPLMQMDLLLNGYVVPYTAQNNPRSHISGCIATRNISCSDSLLSFQLQREKRKRWSKLYFNIQKGITWLCKLHSLLLGVICFQMNNVLFNYITFILICMCVQLNLMK